MNKKIIILGLSIIAVLFVLTTTTYSLFYRKAKLANTESYATGNLSIEVDTTSSGLGNTLSLTNAYPMSDSDGMNTTPYRFKLTNVGNLDYKFNLNLTRSGTINGSYVKVAVDDNAPITLTNTTTTILTDIILLAGENKTISIRVWLDNNTPNSEIGKTFSATLSGTGTGQVYPTLAEKVISLSQGATCNAGASGVYATNSYEVNGTTKYHEYRYIGVDPNNYVKFNDDMYQIIGVFDKNSYDRDSVTNNNYGDYLVKLIAVNSLTSMSWGVYNTTASSGTYSNYSNDWTGSVTGVPASANIMLNQYFLNSDTLTTGYTNSTYGTCSNWTYISPNSSNKNQNCNTIVGYGIKSSLSSYIEEVTWYLKGFNSTSYTTRGDFYNCERGITTGDETKDSNCNSGSTGTADATTNAKIGLMYVSDYTYASGNFACNNTQQISGSFMGNQNWLHNGIEWTITPNSDSAIYGFHVGEDGRVKLNNTYSGYGLRPTFYLKSTIKMKSGSGSFDDPYIIE